MRVRRPGWTVGLSRFIQKLRIWFGVIVWTFIYATQPLQPVFQASAAGQSVRYQTAWGVSRSPNRVVTNPIPGTFVEYDPDNFSEMGIYAGAALLGFLLFKNNQPVQRPVPPAQPDDPSPGRQITSQSEDNDNDNDNDNNDDDDGDIEDRQPEPPPRARPQPQPRPQPQARPQPQPRPAPVQDDERATPGRTVPAGSTSPIGKMLSLGQSRRLAHGPALQWNGCDKSAAIQGGNGNRCGTDYLHPSFAEHVNRHLLSCAQKAAERVGNPPPVKLFISHMGCYANRSIRGGSGLSNHAYARAMDIGAITMIDANGGENKMSSHVRNYNGKNKTMYDTFRECWRQNLPRSCSGQKGSIGIPRSPLGGNGDHNDHIHLEFPPRCG